MLSSCEHSYACYASCMMVTYCLDPSLWQFGTLTGADWRSFNAPQQHLRKELLHLYGIKGPLLSRGSLVVVSGVTHYCWMLVFLIQVSIGFCICCSLSMNMWYIVMLKLRHLFKTSKHCLLLLPCTALPIPVLSLLCLVPALCPA